jgi:hypothetical protein
MAASLCGAERKLPAHHTHGFADLTRQVPSFVGAWVFNGAIGFFFDISVFGERSKNTKRHRIVAHLNRSSSV